MEETWKPVPIEAHSQTHMVSNFGRIKSLARSVPCSHGSYRVTVDKILKADKNSRYKMIQLSKDGKTFLIHRLVALAFIPNAENKPQVNHIDGDRLNNYSCNLEWCTGSENSIHAVKKGLYKYGTIPTELNKNNKPIIAFNNSCEIPYPSTVVAAIALKTTAHQIYRVLRGERKMHRGYKFKRV